MLAVHTGRASDIGRIAGLLVEAEPETAFARGLRCFALLIARVMMRLVQFDFLVNILFHRGSLEWVLFPLALAIGLTPELLPMISSATLAHGAVRVARKQVIVKRLPTINVATLLA